MTFAARPYAGGPYADYPAAGGATFKAAWARNRNSVIGAGASSMKKNVASQVIGVQMCSATDGSAFTGAVTVSVTGDGGTQATGSVGSGACTHEGNGYHTYAPAQAETNYDQIGFTFTGTGAIPSTVQVYPTFPQTGDNYARLGAPAGASVSADVAAVKTQTAAIEVDTQDIQSRLPAALVSGRIDASVGAMASGVLTATAIAADAITDAKVASDVTIASVTGAVGSVTGAVGSVTGNVGGNVTGSVGSVATGGITAASFAADAITAAKIAADVTTELQSGLATAANLATALSDLDDIQTRLPAALVGGRMDASVGAMAANVLTASAVADGAIDRAALAADTGLQSVRSNTAQAGASTSITLDASASATTDFYVNHLVLLTGGTGAGQARYITAYNGTTKVATVSAWATNPDNTSTFALLAGDAIPGATAPTAAQVADAVWDELLSGHAVSGSTGEALSAAGSAGDPWITPLPGAYSAGQAGKIVGDYLNATVSSRATQTSVDTIDGIVDAILVDTAEIGAAGAGLTALASATNLATVAGYLDTEIAAIKAKTDNLPAAPAATGDCITAAGVRAAVGLASANLDTQAAAIKADTAAILVDTGTDGVVVADKTGFRLSSTGVNDILRTALTEGYAADGATFTLEQGMYMVWALLAERSLVSTTLTAKKLDGSTSAMTFTLDDATTPTSQTRAT